MIEYLDLFYFCLCLVHLIWDKEDRFVWVLISAWLLLPQPKFVFEDITLFITYSQLSQILLFFVCSYITTDKTQQYLFVAASFLSLLQTLLILYPLILPIATVLITNHRFIFETLLTYTKSIKLSIVFMTIIFLSYLL